MLALHAPGTGCFWRMRAVAMRSVKWVIVCLAVYSWIPLILLASRNCLCSTSQIAVIFDNWLGVDQSNGGWAAYFGGAEKIKTKKESSDVSADEWKNISRSSILNSASAPCRKSSASVTANCILLPSLNMRPKKSNRHFKTFVKCRKTWVKMGCFCRCFFCFCNSIFAMQKSENRFPYACVVKIFNRTSDDFRA